MGWLKLSFCVNVLSILFALCGVLFWGETILLSLENNTLVQTIDCPTALRLHVIVCAVESLCISAFILLRGPWLRRQVSNRHLTTSLMPSQI